MLVFTLHVLVDSELPVGLTSDTNVGYVCQVMGRIYSTKGDFSTMFRIVHIPVEVETENWFINESLIKHFLERRHDTVDGDSWISQTQNTIELAYSVVRMRK